MRASKYIRWFVRGVLCVSATAGARADELDQAMALARKTLDFVQRSRPSPDLATRLAELERRVATLPAPALETFQRNSNSGFNGYDAVLW